MLIADTVAATSFRGKTGGSEHYITVQAPAELAFADQVRHVEERYALARRELGLAPETTVFRRLYLSDAPNQTRLLEPTGLVRDGEAGPVAVSIVEQAPLPGSKVALLAYHIAGDAPLAKTELAPGHVLITKNGARHLWSTRLCAGADRQAVPTASQTRAVFDRLVRMLEKQGGTLRRNCVRTWLYIKDVDVFYQELVESRTGLFEQQGLTRDTHYLASTGIEGACEHRYDTVLMDAYSNLDLAAGQMSYLNDFDALCATKDYDVTFERGTRLAYADRAHHFISGTASIDHTGQVVHRGDVPRQLGRALDNVAALLRAGGAGLSDMTHLLVYLRDPSDLPGIEGRVRERFPGLPVLFLRGAVCRPEWLVEVEGIAITAEQQPAQPAF